MTSLISNNKITREHTRVVKPSVRLIHASHKLNLLRLHTLSTNSHMEAIATKSCLGYRVTQSQIETLSKIQYKPTIDI